MREWFKNIQQGDSCPHAYALYNAENFPPNIDALQYTNNDIKWCPDQFKVKQWWWPQDDACATKQSTGECETFNEFSDSSHIQANFLANKKVADGTAATVFGHDAKNPNPADTTEFVTGQDTVLVKRTITRTDAHVIININEMV